MDDGFNELMRDDWQLASLVRSHCHLAHAAPQSAKCDMSMNEPLEAPAQNELSVAWGFVRLLHWGEIMDVNPTKGQTATKELSSILSPQCAWGKPTSVLGGNGGFLQFKCSMTCSFISKQLTVSCVRTQNVTLVTSLSLCVTGFGLH